MMQRRSFLGAILAAGVAPAIVHAGILMPVRTIIVPELFTGQGITVRDIRRLGRQLDEGRLVSPYIVFVHPDYYAELMGPYHGARP